MGYDDYTFYVSLAAATAKVVAWAFVALMGFRLYQRIADLIRREARVKHAVSEAQARDMGVSSPGEVIVANWGRVTLWLVLLVLVVAVTQLEPSYRPKTALRTSTPVLVDRASGVTREIGPAEGDARDAANRGYSERNRDENERAREAFRDLPASD